MIRENLTTWIFGAGLRLQLSVLAIPALSLGAQQGNNLPPVPSVSGQLALRVAWPSPNSALVAGDSTFLFGTLGDGRAKLTIAGRPVSVAPNGAWLAWVAIPRDSAFTLSLVGSLDDATTNLSLPLTRADWVRERGAWIDRGSMSPTGRIWVPGGERVVLSVRAAPGAKVRLRSADGRLIPFVVERSLPALPPGIREFDRDDRNLSRTAPGDRWVAVLPASAIPAARSERWLFSGRDSTIATLGRLEVILGRDTTRIPWQLAVSRVSTRPMVRIDDGPDGGAWRPISGRSLPGRGTYVWFFPRGTWTRADARLNNEIRLRLSDGTIAWVPVEAVQPLDSSDDASAALMSSLTFTPAGDRTTLRIPLTRPVATRVDEDTRRLVITLFDAVSVADWTRYGADNRMVRSLAWRQGTHDEVILTLEFDQDIWGWRQRVDGSDLVFEFRPPPRIDPSRPLAGKKVVVDAGHPPGGACGPTGLCEPEANLAIAQLVREALMAEGASVIMTRSTMESVALRARSALADSIDADLFVSIHNNAFPDGVNPFTNNGTSTFFNHPVSLPLARAAQRNLVTAFGLRDLGIARGDLSVVRPTWYPSILTEGMFLMVPAQEAALRTLEVRRRYAAAVVAGVREFLVEVGRRGSTP